MCFSSDRSDRLPNFNHDNVTNNITITNNSPATSPAASPRLSRIAQAGPKHPKVEAAHAEMKRQQEDDDFITCCCFFKMKKLPVRI